MDSDGFWLIVMDFHLNKISLPEEGAVQRLFSPWAIFFSFWEMPEPIAAYDPKARSTHNTDSERPRAPGRSHRDGGEDRCPQPRPACSQSADNNTQTTQTRHDSKPRGAGASWLKTSPENFNFFSKKYFFNCVN